MRLAADFRRSWELRLGRYAKYNFDFSWPSVSLLDLVLADLLGEPEPTKSQHDILIGAAAYLGIVAARCWIRVGSHYSVSLELLERPTPEITLSALVAPQDGAKHSGERATVRLVKLVEQLTTQPPNPFPLYTGFNRPLPPRPFLFAMGSLGVNIGLSPHVTGDWAGRLPQDHYDHIAATLYELSRNSAEYYAQAFPSEPCGADPLLYRGGLIFPALFDGEDHYALRGALSIVEYGSSKGLADHELLALCQNLCYSPDETIACSGFAVAAALSDSQISDRLRWFSESLDIRRALLKPTISIIRRSRGRAGTPLEFLRNGNEAGAVASFARERALHLLPAFRPELLRPDQRQPLMVQDGALAEQLYWGNIVKARDILEGLAESVVDTAPLLLQCCYLDLTLGLPDQADARLRSRQGLALSRDPLFQSGWHELEARVLLERRELLSAQRALLQSIEAPFHASEVRSDRDHLLALRAETLLALDQPSEARALLDELLADGKWSIRAALNRVELDLTKQHNVDLQPDLDLLVGRAPMLRRVMNAVLWYHAIGRTAERPPTALLQ